MKKFLLTLFFILITPSIFAVEFNINETFNQGETILVRVSGNFLNSITSENVFFYRGHVQIPMEFGISKIEGDYYIYALTSGKSSDNYSISIENVQYMKGSEIVKDNLVRNFSITNQSADFSVDPGFAVVSEDFYLEVQNMQDNEIIINVNTRPDNSTGIISISSDSSTESSFSLNPGETKKINFHIGEGKSSLQLIELKTENLTYKIPVYVFTSFEESQMGSFGFDPSILSVSASTNTAEKVAVYLFNSENLDLKDISLSLSDSLNPYVTLSKSKIASLSSNSGIQIELSFLSNAEKKVEGTIKAISGNKTALGVVSVNFADNYVSQNETPSITKRTCAEMNGTICDSDEECSIESVYAKDSVCCLGTCKSAGSGSAGKIIAIIISFVLVAGVAYFYFKYKKAKKPVNLVEIAKGKETLGKKI